MGVHCKAYCQRIKLFFRAGGNAPQRIEAEPPAELCRTAGRLIFTPIGDLVGALFARLLAAALARQCLFYALLFAGLEVKGVALDLLDDVLLLHFALKAAQRIFQRFTFLNADFCQA